MEPEPQEQTNVVREPAVDYVSKDPEQDWQRFKGNLKEIVSKPKAKKKPKAEKK